MTGSYRPKADVAKRPLSSKKRSLNWAFRASGKLSGRVLDRVIPPKMTGMRVGAIALDRRYDKSIDTSDIRMLASRS
jgi:hypothetical protein